jgi:hypothetical protein
LALGYLPLNGIAIRGFKVVLPFRVFLKSPSLCYLLNHNAKTNISKEQTK